MQSGLEVEALLALVFHQHLRVELIGLQRHREGALEVLVPHISGVVGGRQLELEHGVGHADDIPGQVAGEPVLLDGAGSELRPAVRQTARNGLGPVEGGVGPDGDELGAVGAVAVRRHHAAQQVDLRRGARVGVRQLDVLETVGVLVEAGPGGRLDLVHRGPAAFDPPRPRRDLLAAARVKQGRRRRR